MDDLLNKAKPPPKPEIFQGEEWTPSAQQKQQTISTNHKKHSLGIRPHRCDYRLEEWIQGTAQTLSIRESWRLWKVFFNCMRAEPGQEAQEPIIYMKAEDRLFYEQLQAKGQIRQRFFEQSKE